MPRNGNRRTVQALVAQLEAKNGMKSLSVLVRTETRSAQAVVWQLMSSEMEASAQFYDVAKAAYLDSIASAELNPQWLAASNEHYSVDGNSKYYWVNKDGLYIGTDNALFDPHSNQPTKGAVCNRFHKVSQGFTRSDERIGGNYQTHSKTRHQTWCQIGRRRWVIAKYDEHGVTTKLQILLSRFRLYVFQPVRVDFSWVAPGTMILSSKQLTNKRLNRVG